jgi:hypothetical protein
MHLAADHEPGLAHKNGLDLSIASRIILYCARTTPGPELSASITDLIKQVTDWDYVFSLAAKHGLLLFLVHNVNRAVPAFLPQTIVTDVRRRYSATNRSSSRELRELTSLFAAHRVRVISYKGPTLAGIDYNNQPLRGSADLDFLVHPRDYRQVLTLLSSQGYTPYMDCGYKYHLWHPKKQIDLDLHRALAPRRYLFTIAFDYAWQRSMRLAMPHGGDVLTFCLEDLVIVLCLDLVKDIAQPGNFRLLKITDIAELMKYSERIDWTALVQRARAARLVRVTYFGLLLAERVCGATLPPDIGRNIEGQARRFDKIVNSAMRVILDERWLMGSDLSETFHELKMVAVLQDRRCHQILVVILYLASLVRLQLKSWYARITTATRGYRQSARSQTG